MRTHETWQAWEAAEEDGAGGSASAPQAEPNKATPVPVHPFAYGGAPQRWEGPVFATAKTAGPCGCVWLYAVEVEADDVGKNDRIPDYVPDRFPEYVPDGHADRCPTGNRFPSRLVPPRCRVVPSHPVKQMASHVPVPFPSRGRQTGTFSRTVPRERPKIFFYCR